MALAAGQRLLHYRLVAKIGEGGMGVVWKAHDTTLDRPVAIKVLPEAFAADAERLGRFQREAKTLAALNHPSIAAIYGLHEAGGLRFLAMEYVEGEDLAGRMRRGPLPVEEALAIARDIADALSAAHAIGVVHRDLKPANVVLAVGGAPKVLDFGLAKATAPAALSGSGPTNLALSPTVTSFGTRTGAHVILGTAAYMAPEQARGKPVDRRADLWALGAVLYEMLTGMAPFDGETISDTLASVLKTEPAWESLPLATPSGVRRLLRRCLQKDPRQRLHDAADARIELVEALEGKEDGAAPSAPAAGRGKSLWYLVGVAAAVLIVGAALGFALRGAVVAPGPAAAPRIVSSLLTPPGVTIVVREVTLALAPDGEQLAFVGMEADGRSRIYVRRLDAVDARPLPGTEGVETFFWSHDGKELGFHAGSQLMRIPVEGGTPRVVAQVEGKNGAWNSEGTIVFAPPRAGPLLRVDAGGGTPVPLEGTDLGRRLTTNMPQFLPDGRRFLYALLDLASDASGVWVGELGSTEVRRLVPGLTNGSWSAGRLLYMADGGLMAWPLDPETLEPSGEPQSVASSVMLLNYPFLGLFSVAGERLAYLAAGESVGQAEIVWVDRSGAMLEHTGIAGDLYNPRLSRDGRLLALDVSTRESHGDIWIFDLARRSSRRLTQDPTDESRPVWTPDDREILFFRHRDLHAIDAGGHRDPIEVHVSPHSKSFQDVSPDGRSALFLEIVDGDPNLRLLDRESGEVRDWLATEAAESNGRFAPDGAWAAYQSDETGRSEVWIDRFPERGERFRVSAEGGTAPVWRRDGKELFYVSPAGDLMAVPIDMASDRAPIGEPQRLFHPRLHRDQYDISVDGERFLLVQRIDVEVSSVVLVQNWAPAATP
jgi:Tol biopolymer transport system component